MVDFIFMVEKGLKEGKPNARLSFMRHVAYWMAPLFVVVMVFGIFWDIVLGKTENVDLSWFFFNVFLVWKNWDYFRRMRQAKLNYRYGLPPSPEDLKWSFVLNDSLVSPIDFNRTQFSLLLLLVFYEGVEVWDAVMRGAGGFSLLLENPVADGILEYSI